MTPKEVLLFAERSKVQMVDIRFTDLPGLWHHVSFPVHAL
jgi:glutamine synthetase